MISLIVAMTEDSLIGADGIIPWICKEDLQQFRRLTLGHTVVMGRKTFYSLGSVPLPGRHNVVLSRQNLDDKKDITFRTSVKDCIYYLPCMEEEIFVIGGAEVYAQFARFIDRMYITEILTEVKPTGILTYFPWKAFSGMNWECVDFYPLGSNYFYQFDRI